MKAFDFGNGRIVECDTDFSDGFVHDWSNGYFLKMYPYIRMKNYEERCSKLGMRHIEDEDIVIDCLLKDVQEFGIDKIVRAMRNFEIAIACSDCGIAPPSGPLDWD